MPAEGTPETSPSVSELQLRIEELADQLRSRTSECEEGLQREAAMAEILRAISDPTADLARVFEVMIETVAKLCAAHGYVWLYDGKQARAIAGHVEQPFKDWLRDRAPFVPAEASALGQAILHKRLVHVVDAAEHEGYRAFRNFREIIDKGGVRTLLHVPLCRGDDVLGVITVYRQERRPFSDRQIALLESFAAQAVIALENTRLVGDLRERTGELARSVNEITATSDVLKIISRSPVDLPTVLDTLVETAARLCRADHATVWRQRDGLFHMMASHGTSNEANRFYAANPIEPTRGTVTGRVALERKPVHIIDAAADQDYTYREGQALIGFRTMLGIPLLREESLIGVFVINRTHVEAFTGKEIELVTTFADQAVIAIENARLFEELHDREAELRVTLDNISGGVAMFDAGLRLRAWSRNFQQIMDLSDEDLAIRPTYGQYLRLLANRGEFGAENVDAFIAGFLEDTDKELRYERTRPDGRSVEVRRNRVPGGGFVLIYIDITERKKAEAEIAAARDAAEATLERQTATADILRVIANSPSDVQPVFDAIAERSNHLIGGLSTAVYRLDDDVLHLMSFTPVSPEADAALKALHPRPLSTPALRETIRAGKVHRTSDTEAELRDHPEALAVARLRGFRSRVLVPLVDDGEPIGIIGVTRAEPGAIPDEHVDLLKTFADQAVIAIRNAGLFNELREALQRQTATTEVLEVINASPGTLAPVFEAMLEKAMSLCEASFGSLWTLEGDRFHPVAHRGLPASYADYLRRDLPAAGTGTGRARLLAGEAFAHIADLADDEPYRTGEPHRRALVDLGGARTALLVPLRRDDIVCGFIMIYRQEVRPFMDKQIGLLQTFAAQAVIAMENARLLGELRERTDQVAELNRGLEARVAEQVEELGRVGRLKRFLAPQLAKLIVSQGDEKILESHRREIVVVFCDVRGYTAFAETAEPEEVLDFLREYHGALGPLVSQFEGTLDQFSGDGIMVFFNDPVPIPDPAERSVRMAVAMREAASALIAAWRERGRELGFGVGIAQGYATLGQIGFSERSGYTAIGTVCNVAARLCAEAKDGQILLAQRVNVALKGSIATEQLGTLVLKGLTQPVVAYNVPSTASQPALRVVDGGGH